MSDLQPGWYQTDDASGRMKYLAHDGEWIDPMVAFEENAADMLLPVLEQVFEAGFEAGVQSAAKLAGITSMIR